MRWSRCLILLLALTSAQPVGAVQPDEKLTNQQLEARARNLSRELRCLVCQNQSIDDSDASLARDLRVLVRERLQAGDSDQQVLDFLTARYGEFVLLRPRFGWHTALLWLLPGAFLVIGAFSLTLLVRRRASEQTELTSEEQTRLAELMDSQGGQLLHKPDSASGSA